MQYTAETTGFHGCAHHSAVRIPRPSRQKPLSKLSRSATSPCLARLIIASFSEPTRLSVSDSCALSQEKDSSSGACEAHRKKRTAGHLPLTGSMRSPQVIRVPTDTTRAHDTPFCFLKPLLSVARTRSPCSSNLVLYSTLTHTAAGLSLPR